jgi:membrane associated rhomboid family serine protease
MSHSEALELKDNPAPDTIGERPVRLTYVVLGVNILIFSLMTFAGGSTNPDTLVAFGAKSNTAIDRGEIWRFLTPVFIHIGLIHFVVNSYGLWKVGPLVERTYGGARFAALYLTAGIGGTVASYRFNPYAPSAGASGAIFGLLGVMLVFCLRYRNSIPAPYRKALMRGVASVVIVTLIVGLAINQLSRFYPEVPRIDNAGHLGGLIAGAALAALIPIERPGATPNVAGKVIQAFALLAVALSFFQVYYHYNGPRLSSKVSLSLNPMTHNATPGSAFVSALNGAQGAFNKSIAAFAAQDAAGVAKARAGTSRALDELRAAPSLSDAADALLQELLAVMQDQSALERDVERERIVTFSHTLRGKENTRRFKEIDRRFKDWVRTEGREYGSGLPQQE